MGKPRLSVEVGQRIGAGVIIETDLRIPRPSGKPGRTDRAARLLCDCGNEYVFPVHNLVGQRNPRLSCGCLTGLLRSAGRAAAAARATALGRRGCRFIDRTGQRYGKLVVIELGSPAPGHKIRWLCRCDCGNEKLIRTECLSKGISTSCGCSQHEPKLPPGVAARNVVLKCYKGAARTRGYVWELADADFDRLISQECFYCGSPPSNIQTTGASRFVYSGIDRMDNTLGYFPGNVVTCCRTCNYAKADLPYDDFIAWIGRLVAHQMFSPDRLPSRLLAKAS